MYLATWNLSVVSVKRRLRTAGQGQNVHWEENAGWVQNAEWGLLLLLQIASWCQLHTLLPSRSTLHICPKFQWTFEQLKAAYLEVQYFHRRSSKFPVKHFSLLLEWFTPFFNRHYSFDIWDSNFYLSINIVVLYKFMVTCIQNFTT